MSLRFFGRKTLFIGESPSVVSVGGMRVPSALVRGVVGSCVVAAASLVTSVVPESSWVASLPIASDLRATLPGRMTGLTLMVAGLGLMVWAWLSVGREVLAGVRHRLVPMAAWWSAPLLLMPPLFSRDAWSYAAQGALVAKGYDPYSVGPACCRATGSKQSTRCG